MVAPRSKKCRGEGRLMDDAQSMALGSGYGMEDGKELEALNLAEGASRWMGGRQGRDRGGMGRARGDRGLAVDRRNRRGRQQRADGIEVASAP